jgi:hypothetical protein
VKIRNGRLVVQFARLEREIDVAAVGIASEGGVRLETDTGPDGNLVDAFRDRFAGRVLRQDFPMGVQVRGRVDPRGVSSTEYELAGSRYLGEFRVNAVYRVLSDSAPAAYGLLMGLSCPQPASTAAHSAAKAQSRQMPLIFVRSCRESMSWQE